MATNNINNIDKELDDTNNDNNTNDTANTSDNNQPKNLANTLSDENKDKETKNVALIGKDAENMLKNQKQQDLLNQPKPDNQPSTNNNNPTKKNTKKNNLNANANNLKRNANLTQKQSDDAPNTATPTETANSELEGSENTPTSKDTMISLNKLTMNLLNHQIVVKLFHFQTELYGAHKASDAYLEKYAQTMDKFLEIAQGIYGKITLKKYTLTGSSHTDDNIVKHIDGMITLLRDKIDDVLGDYTDLINIRDELVGDAEQLKYLLSFK